jgi:hypothetical protein
MQPMQPMQTAIEAAPTPEVLIPPPVPPPAAARPAAPAPAPSPPPATTPPPGALRALYRGARRVLQQPRLLLFFWGLSLATSLLASVPALATLSNLLGKRPAAAQIARGGADYLLGELAGDNQASIGVILGSALVAAVTFFIAQLVLSGGLLSALRRPGDPLRVGPAVGAIVARGLATAWSMVRLELLFFLLIRLPVVALCGGALALAVRGKFIDTHNLSEILMRLLPLVGLTLWLWCAGTIVLYAARLHRLAQIAGGGSALRALAGGLRQTLGRGGAVGSPLTLALIDGVGMVGLVVLGRVLAAHFDYALLVIAALLVRQGFALLRCLLTLSVMAGTVELCTSTA